MAKNRKGKNRRTPAERKVEKLGVVLDLDATPERTLKHVLARYSNGGDTWSYYAVDYDKDDHWGYYNCLLIFSVLAFRRCDGAGKGAPPSAEDMVAPAALHFSDPSYGNLARHYYLRRDMTTPYHGLSTDLREGIQELFPAPSEGKRQPRVTLTVADKRNGTFYFWTTHEPFCKDLTESTGTVRLGDPAPPTSLHIEEHLGQLIRDITIVLNREYPPKSRRRERTGRTVAPAPGSVLGQGPVVAPDLATIPHSGAAKGRLSSHIIQFESLIDDRIRDFAKESRTFVFDELDRFLQNTSVKSGYFLITGEPGIGKSAILAKLVRDRNLQVHHFNIMSEGTNTPPRCLGNLCARIIRTYGLGYSALPDGFERSSAFLSKLLYDASVRHSGKLLVVVDALDEVADEGRGRELNPLRLPEALPPNVYVIVTSRRIDEALPGTSVRRVHIDSRGEDNILDIRRFVESYLPNETVQRWMAAWNLNDQDFCDLMCSRSNGNFMYVCHVLRAIAQGHFSDTPPGQMPCSLKAYYQFHWDAMRRRLDPTCEPLCRRVVAILVAAREAVSAAEVARWTGLDCWQVSQVFAEWDEFLCRQPGDDTRYRVYHSAFLDFLSEHVCRDVTAPHGMIADSCLGRVREQRRDADRPGPRIRNPYSMLSSYELHHLVDHLVLSRLPNTFDELERILTDLPFLEARARQESVFDLVEDYARALQAIPPEWEGRWILELLDEALRREAHFIQAHPATLFQCLWNTGWWYDSEEAAAHYRQLGVATNSGRTRLPWTRCGQRLYALMERWRELTGTGRYWLRSLRPPTIPLGAGQVAYLRGHEAWVASVAFSHYGARIATASSDETVRIWDAATGTPLACFRSDTGMIRSVAYSPDGTEIAIGAVDGTVRIWSAETRQEWGLLAGRGGDVRSVAYLPDGKRIVCGSDDGTVRVWQLDSNPTCQKLVGHEGRVWCVAASHNDRVASGSEDGTVRIWDARSGKEVHCLRGHQGAVHGVALTPDGRLVVSGSDDKTVRVWNADAGVESLCLTEHEGPVSSVAVSVVAGQIISGSADRTVRVWDMHNGRQLACHPGYEAAVTCVAASADGRLIAAGSSVREVRLWDTAKVRACYLTNEHLDEITCLAFSPDGRFVASGSADKTVRVWDALQGCELQRLARHQGQVADLMFSTDATHLVSAGWDGTVRIWEVASGHEVHCLSDHDAPIDTVRYDASGEEVMSGCQDGMLYRWSVRTGELLGKRRVKGIGAMRCFAPSIGGSRFAAGGHERVVCERTGSSEPIVLCLEETKGQSAESIAYSSDERRLAAGFTDPLTCGKRLVLVWDIESECLLETIDGEGDVRAIAEGAPAFPYRAIGRGDATAIEASSTREPVAWLSTRLYRIRTHPSGRMWAGVSGSALCLFTLEEE
ncbi:MAG: hypothetical protein QUV05_20155 [Phycisphaerae bacterium]|nr:hypothetical protein [Phycisphaerae bacterium]